MSYDIVTIDGFEYKFVHDYEAEDFYFNGGEMITFDQVYAMLESEQHK